MVVSAKLLHRVLSALEHPPPSPNTHTHTRRVKSGGFLDKPFLGRAWRRQSILSARLHQRPSTRDQAALTLVPRWREAGEVPQALTEQMPCKA